LRPMTPEEDYRLATIEHRLAWIERRLGAPMSAVDHLIAAEMDKRWRERRRRRVASLRRQRLKALASSAEIDVDSLEEAIDAVEEEIGLLAANDLDCDDFSSLHAKLSQARDLIDEAKAAASVLVSAKSPPSTNEPCKLPPRPRR
jgi:hypothetical protein